MLVVRAFKPNLDHMNFHFLGRLDQKGIKEKEEEEEVTYVALLI